MSEIWDVQLQLLCILHTALIRWLQTLVLTLKIGLMSKLSSRTVFPENQLSIDEGQGVRFRGWTMRPS